MAFYSIKKVSINLTRGSHYIVFVFYFIEYQTRLQPVKSFLKCISSLIQDFDGLNFRRLPRVCDQTKISEIEARVLLLYKNISKVSYLDRMRLYVVWSGHLRLGSVLHLWRVGQFRTHLAREKMSWFMACTCNDCVHLQ